MECKKCKNISNVVLRKTDNYCGDCFVINVNHKFRACIGKNKILCKNERVLVCISGGLGSSVLLNLIHNGLSMDNHKKLRISPLFLHIMDSESDSNSIADTVIQNCRNHNFKVYVVRISQYMESTTEPPVENSIPPARIDLDNQYSAMMSKLLATTINDSLQYIKRNLYLQMAKQLDCSYVFTGETTTTLAINLLSNLALGRGSQVEDDVGFCDSRDKIKILRAMKDITAEELDQYIIVKQIGSIRKHKMKPKNSLQSLIGAFVSDLQENFPATISTVCKTADKLGVNDYDQRSKKCMMCESDLGKGNSKLTALEATQFSRIVSYVNPQESSDSTNHLEEIEKHRDVSLFPHINTHLCYSCSRNYYESNKSNVPSHIQKSLQN